MEEISIGKRVLIVIAPEGFRDEEYFEPKAVFESQEIEVITASNTSDACMGKLGRVVRPELTISDVNPNEFDAVLFVGGPGMAKFLQDPEFTGLAKKFYQSGKVTAAICIAPSVLANAGLLNGKKATAFPSQEGHLLGRGAFYTGKPVERDGKIVTANGPEAARAFGKEVVKVLKG